MNRIEYKRYSTKEKLEEGKEYEWRFGKIKYMKKGAGNPILLLHDLEIGSSSYEFHRLTEKLSETREVYTLDFLDSAILKSRISLTLIISMSRW